jgi:CheY-like chemotaxis protein
VTHVLVVEDQQDTSLAWRTLLLQYGWRVGDAADARSALEYVARYRVDVVLVDLLLPGIDGLDLIKALREDESNPCTIAITGLDTMHGVDALDAANAAGADRALRKPVTRQQLIDTVLDVLEHGHTR